MEDVKTYTGIADCHGIESFIPKGETPQGYLIFRAEANYQRHAVVYEADMKEEDATMVGNLIKDNAETAFKFMNNTAVEIRLAGQRAPKLWSNLPNPNLDPYHA